MPVDFLFDYASPWAYLANELLATHLPGVEIAFQPIWLRALEGFSKGLPYLGAKLRYVGNDYHRCAAHEGIATQFPGVFPINGLHALRGALHAQRAGGFAAYHQAMFRAAWRDNQDIGRKDVVIDLAVAAGQERAAFTAALDDPAIKDQLKQVSAAAEARGVFGVPTFFVGDEMFWGHDRMDYVRRAASPPTA